MPIAHGQDGRFADAADAHGIPGMRNERDQAERFHFIRFGPEAEGAVVGALGIGFQDGKAAPAQQALSVQAAQDQAVGGAQAEENVIEAGAVAVHGLGKTQPRALPGGTTCFPKDG